MWICVAFLVANTKPEDRKPGVSWQFMCPSGGYLDLMLRQTEEICQRYPVDGLWYDITGGPPCYCEDCRRGMRLDAFQAHLRWAGLEISPELIVKQRR